MDEPFLLLRERDAWVVAFAPGLFETMPELPRPDELPGPDPAELRRDLLRQTVDAPAVLLDCRSAGAINKQTLSLLLLTLRDLAARATPAAICGDVALARVLALCRVPACYSDLDAARRAITG